MSVPVLFTTRGVSEHVAFVASKIVDDNECFAGRNINVAITGMP